MVRTEFTEDADFVEGAVVVSVFEPANPAIGRLWLDLGAVDMAQDVSITSPVTAFDEVSMAELTPVVQLQYPYAINSQLIETRLNGGTATIDSNRLKLSTGAAANRLAMSLSRKALKYNPGQGAMVRFTALFTTGVANSTQLIGIGDQNDGFFFGYNASTFGVLHRSGGASEMRLLTVTTGSSTAEDITITLDGDAATTVSVTNTADTTLTANEIAAHDYSGVGDGWTAHAMGATVRFMSYTSGSK